MPTVLTQLVSQLQAVWSPLNRAQKLSLIGVAIGAVLAIAFFGFTATQTPYGTLFTRLNAQDAGAITARLRELNVPYQLAEGGATIRVPESQVYETRLQLAQAGLPKSGTVGFELFDNQNLLSLTDFSQRMNYQRALEGELARTIGQMTLVEQARVHLVLPQERLFSQQQRQPSASVVLRLRPNTRLESQHVQSITNLVAASVEGLTPRNVTIVDANGNTLWDESQVTTANQPNRQAQSNLEMQIRYEREMEQRIQQLLERVIGPGRTSVKVSAEMNWDQVTTAREQFDPTGVPRSQRTTTEQFNGTNPVNLPPGVTANTPGFQPTLPIQNNGRNEFNRNDTVTNFEVGRTVISTTQTPGSVRRLSVAVFVDNLTDPAAVQAMSQAVANAAGLSAERGDSITVSNIAFDRTQAEVERRVAEVAAQQATYATIARYAALALALLIVLMVIRGLFKPKKDTVAVVTGDGKVVVSDIEPGQLPAGSKTPEQNAISDAIEKARAQIEDSNSPMAIHSRMLEDQLTNIARTKPHMLADLMERWIDEKE